MKEHDTALEGKRWCGREGNCFGIGTKSGLVYSFEFPLLLAPGGVYTIHKKEKISGIFIHHQFQIILDS